MKTKKCLSSLFFILIILVDVFFSVSMTSASAAQVVLKYKEYITKLAIPMHEEVSPERIIARENGVVDYFVTADNILGNAEETLPTWFHSDDYGKTWKEMDMTWITNEGRKYGRGVFYKDFYMTQQGDVYGIVEIGRKKKETEEMTYFIPLHKIFKRVNGQAVEIPNLELCNWDSMGFKIASVEDNGDIVLWEDFLRNDNLIMSMAVYDQKTGALKQKTECPKPNFFEKAYANGICYGLDYSNQSAWRIVGYDMRSGKIGKEVLSIPFPDSNFDYVVEAMSVKKDGTLYFSAYSGLYRLDPGTNTPIKLINGENCRLGKGDAYCRQSAVSPEGDFYTPIYFTNPKNEKDPQNRALGKFYRYSPK